MWGRGRRRERHQADPAAAASGQPTGAGVDENGSEQNGLDQNGLDRSGLDQNGLDQSETELYRLHLEAERARQWVDPTDPEAMGIDPEVCWQNSELIDQLVARGEFVRLAAVLEQVPEDLPSRVGVAVLAARQALIAHLEAGFVVDLHQLTTRYTADRRFLAEELALALGTGVRTIQFQIKRASLLCRTLPGTLAALRAGRITADKARTIVDAVKNAPADIYPAVEADVLPDAAFANVPTLKNRLVSAVITLDPEGAAARHRSAVRDREMVPQLQQDGMSALRVLGSTEAISRIFQMCTAVAGPKVKGDDRGIGARRVDALDGIAGEILGTGMFVYRRTEGSSEAVQPVPDQEPPHRDRPDPLPVQQGHRPRIGVVIGLSTLIGLDDLPAVLNGSTPITAEQGRAIALGGDLVRMLTDEGSGIVLDYGRTSYQPPQSLIDLVVARDGTCQVPGCWQPADRSQIDHQVEFRPGAPEGGTTSLSNLRALCAHHHQLRHSPDWQVDTDPATRVTTVRTPLGFSVTGAPPRPLPDGSRFTRGRPDDGDGLARGPGVDRCSEEGNGRRPAGGLAALVHTVVPGLSRSEEALFVELIRRNFAWHPPRGMSLGEWYLADQDGPTFELADAMMPPPF